jgi:hypothetical protein
LDLKLSESTFPSAVKINFVLEELLLVIVLGIVVVFVDGVFLASALAFSAALLFAAAIASAIVF